eukprot:118601-Pyramimonas_sp.AAC.1
MPALASNCEILRISPTARRRPTARSIYIAVRAAGNSPEKGDETEGHGLQGRNLSRLGTTS